MDPGLDDDDSSTSTPTYQDLSYSENPELSELFDRVIADQQGVATGSDR